MSRSAIWVAAAQGNTACVCGLATTRVVGLAAILSVRHAGSLGAKASSATDAARRKWARGGTLSDEVEGESPFWKQLRFAEQRQRHEAARRGALGRAGADGSKSNSRIERRDANKRLHAEAGQEVDAFLVGGPFEAIDAAARGATDAAEAEFTFMSESASDVSTAELEVRNALGKAPLIVEIDAHARGKSDASRLEPAASPPALSPGIERLLACRSTRAALELCAAILTEVQSHSSDFLSTSVGSGMDASKLDQLALAVQILGSWASAVGGRHRAGLLRDSRLEELMRVLGNSVDDLAPWALVSTFLGVAKLGAAHACVPALVDAANARLDVLSVGQAAVLLRSLGEAPALSGSKAGGALKDSLLEILRKQSDKLDAIGAVAVAPALVRLRVSDLELGGAIASRVHSGVKSLDIRDVALANSSLAALRVVHAPLMRATEKVVQRNMHLCNTPRGVTQLCAALSRGQEVDPMTFVDFLMPAARSFLTDFGARDICTVAEAFCNVGVADPEFMAELAAALEPKVSLSDVGAHEVSVALNVFAPVAHAAPGLFSAVATKAARLAEELSPRQLARVLRGLANSGCGTDTNLMHLRRRATNIAGVMYGTDAVDCLMALIEMQQLTPEALDTLMVPVTRSLGRLPAQDDIALLHMLSKIPSSMIDRIPPGLVEEVLQALRRRGQGTWRLDLDDVTHFIEALRGLQREDDTLIELVCRRLHLSLKKSDCSMSQLLRILAALGHLPPRSRQNVLTHLRRRPRLLDAVHHTVMRQLTTRVDFETEVCLARGLARIGYEDEMTQHFLDRVTAEADEYLDGYPPELTCDLCWALSELNWQLDWTRTRLKHFVNNRYVTNKDTGLPPDAVAADALLRLAWSLAVHNQAIPSGLLQELHILFDASLPVDWSGDGMMMLQVIALHVKMRAGLGKLTGDLDVVAEWLQLALEVPRPDLYQRQAPPRQQRSLGRVVVKRYPHEHWLSGALAQLRLTHEAGVVIGGVHRVAVAFKKQKHVIDVLGVEDMSAPANRTLGSAELRRRQLLEMGWAVHPLRLRELYDATRTGELRLLVSRLLSAFDPTAARASSFRKSSIKSKSTGLDRHAGSTRVAMRILSARPKRDGLGCEASGESDEEDEGAEVDSWGRLSPAAALREQALMAKDAVAEADRERLVG